MTGEPINRSQLFCRESLSLACQLFRHLYSANPIILTWWQSFSKWNTILERTSCLRDSNGMGDHFELDCKSLTREGLKELHCHSFGEYMNSFEWVDEWLQEVVSKVAVLRWPWRRRGPYWFASVCVWRWVGEERDGAEQVDHLARKKTRTE